MLDMPVFGQVPGGDVFHLNRHELIHRLALLEIWIELFTELTPSAGLRVVDLSSYRGSMEIHVEEFLIALDFEQHMPRCGNRSILRGANLFAVRFPY
jgi:hypothetical protein